jgi:hypothetical protein
MEQVAVWERMFEGVTIFNYTHFHKRVRVISFAELRFFLISSAELRFLKFFKLIS